MSRRPSDQAFWRKLQKLPKRAYRDMAERLVLLYVLLTDSSTPAWAKAAIAAALAYFIVPTDAVPDWLPMGYSDDAVLLASVLAKLSGLVRPHHRKKVRDILG